MKKLQNFIKGKSVDSASGETTTLSNPSTGQAFATLSAGQPFGEQAVLAGGVRSATARAKEATVCMELTATGLQQILEKESDISRVVFRALLLQLYMANRLRHK